MKIEKLGCLAAGTFFEGLWVGGRKKELLWDKMINE
jgi:hypothetical protein